MHITKVRKTNKAATNQPNRVIDTGSHQAYLNYAMSVVVGRPKHRIDAVAAKAGTAARRRTASQASSQAEASGTGVSSDSQGSGSAGGDGNSDDGDSDGDGPGLRLASQTHLSHAPSRSSSSEVSRPTRRSRSSSPPDPDLPHRRGLNALVLVTLILVCTAIILGLTGHEWLAFEVLAMAGGLPRLAVHLVKPK